MTALLNARQKPYYGPNYSSGNECTHTHTHTFNQDEGKQDDKRK